MGKQSNEDNAIWGTVTLALPQITEWNIEGTDLSENGTNLKEFLKTLDEQGDGNPVTLSINLIVGVGE